MLSIQASRNNKKGICEETGIKLMNKVMNDGPPWLRNGKKTKKKYENMCSIKGRRPIIASDHEHVYYDGVR